MSESAYDIFVSYAHADDEIPAGARNGWVTTLVEELNKVLRRKLGGSGARIWMDHQLAANANVLNTLLATLRSSRTLLLVMSPGYHQSVWCQRELGNFLSHILRPRNTRTTSSLLTSSQCRVRHGIVRCKH